MNLCQTHEKSVNPKWFRVTAKEFFQKFRGVMRLTEKIDNQ